MDLPDIRDLDVKGKKVLLRADLNVPMQDGDISDASRLDAAIPTFRNILDRGGRLVIIAHLDRPGGERDLSSSLRTVADAIRDRMDGSSVAFAEDCIGETAQNAVGELSDGQCLVLENLRFHAGEKDNDAEFAKALADLADIYVNDAFSVCHREHASIVAVPGLRPSAAGLLLQKELRMLSRHLSDPLRPYVALLGGAKTKTKVPLVDHLLDQADSILLGGVMAPTFLRAKGFETGRSKIDDDQVDKVMRLLDKADASGANLIVPSDVVVASELQEDAKTRTVNVAEVEPDDMILDIGADTIRWYADTICAAETVVWNGPMGAVEYQPFRNGTRAMASAIGERTGADALWSVVGGGDTLAFLKQEGHGTDVTYASMAGGAFLQWLSGRTLPGIAALEAEG